MRLRLEDRGEGWYWPASSIEVEVLDVGWTYSRLFYRVALPAVLEVSDSGVPAEAGISCGPFDGAWLSPRWVGHEVNLDHPITALLWLTGDVQRAGRPPRDVDWSARVECVEVD